MTRIALVLQGDPTRPGAWSGVPAGLTSGLTAAGCEVVPIRAQFRGAGRVARLFGMSWAQQATSRLYSAACGRAGDRALRSHADIEGVVVLGTGYALSADLPTVTFEDMTVAQAQRRSDPVYDSLSEAGKARWRERQRHIYERSCGCCVTSKWAAASIRDDYGIDPAKIHVVGCGRNMESVPTDRSWEVPRFLWVGSDWRRKRGAAVLDAFAAVRARHPRATLDMVGDHPAIDAPGVTGHGRLPLGTAAGAKQYRALLDEATCFLMPSNYEPFGIAYLDAAAAGVPSIGTTVGGAPDAVGEGGRVVDPTDAAALREAMLELADPATCQALGQVALARSELFTWQAVAERLLRVLAPPTLDTRHVAETLGSPSPLRQLA